tara:strand:- start:592 stop:1761 length:1170 start_codon:yes stop_codon:yes gene_type:complete
MANKRIKISELPKIAYNPDAGPTDSTLTSQDFLPIAVTDSINAAVKTTMTVTSRELQRFILQQSASNDDAANVLTIGRGGTTVNVSSLSANKLIVSGDTILEKATITTFITDTITTGSSMKVGNSIYPAVLYDNSNNIMQSGLMVSDSNGKFSGKGTSLQTLIQSTPVAATGQAGMIAKIDASGKLVFTTDSKSLLASSGSVTLDSALHGNVLAVSNDGAMNPSTNLKLVDVITTVETVTSQIADAGINDQKIITTSSATPEIGDLVVSRDHITLASTVKNEHNASNIDSTSSPSRDRIIFNAPIVIGAKHEDDQDLTERAISKMFPAVIGEIRWNIFNTIPTIYLAVSNDIGSDATAGAKTWYGIPMFGTIDSTTTGSSLTGGYTDDD